MSTTRLLLVDDVAQVRQDLRTLLNLVGVAGTEHPIEVVGEAANGLEALQQLEALQPEAVLLDLEMPVMDGYEAARRIKSQAPACRVIALTVHSYDSARRRAMQAGVDAFVVKGAPLETLLQAIDPPKSADVSKTAESLDHTHEKE